MSLASMIAGYTVTIQRQTVTKDASGGAVRTWAALYSSVPMKLDEVQSGDGITSNQPQLSIDYVGYTQQSGIGKEDRIVTPEGKFVVVTGVQKFRARGGIGTFYMVRGTEFNRKET